MARSRVVDSEKLSHNTKRQQELLVGTAVAIQNQAGKLPTKWDKTGVIVENRENEQLVIKVDGSRRLMLRNRRFVKPLLSRTQDLPDMPLPTTTPQPHVTLPTTMPQPPQSVPAPPSPRN